MPRDDTGTGRRCDRAVERARRQLGRHSPERFASAFWYGAVDIDPAHLVVWVLLSGPPDELPVWYFPGPAHADGGRYDAALSAEIDNMRGIVLACFAREGWPDAERVRVGFDSQARVDAEGGWHYFK
jgi:hypothetical protein